MLWHRASTFPSATRAPTRVDLAIETLAQERSALSPAQANREVYGLLKDGLPVAYRDDNGEEALQTLRVIDWRQPERNDFFLASQFWVAGDMGRRRADLAGFVNGLPLVLIELKAVHRRLEDAYSDNLRDYKAIIPQLFPYNAFIIVSNGAESRIGTLTAAWEHFAEWKRVGSEDEAGAVSLETIIRGTCEKERLLDIVENFILFREGQGALVKLLAKNHQYLGVNNAVRALETLPEQRGRLGVFWHTQGSGKSLSMVFFVQKTLRRLPGAWTFLIVTDRLELDDQIYKTFTEVGAVTERQVHASSGVHLQHLLRESHRTVFTLIQKFQAPPGVAYPPLSERSDIIVITDEAHRSQYETLALNMRNALPNAAFLAFTGTPLLANEGPTRRVFGDYVSVYNFAQSVADGATVPLYYENRVPELQLARANRVVAGKTNGLIVDYVGVFRDLQAALAIYGSHDGATDPGDLPVQAKEQAVDALRLTLEELDAFCRERGAAVAAIIAAAGFSRLKLLDDAFDALLTNDQTKNAYLALAAGAAKGYRAILPDPAANAFAPALACHAVLAAHILSVAPRPDILRVMAGVEQLLDAYITPEERRVGETPGVYRAGPPTDLNTLDVELLRQQFAEHRQIAAARLRAAIGGRLQVLVQRNRTRLNYQERFQRLIDAYNAGTVSIEAFFAELTLLARDLEAEGDRAARDGLSEEELDLLRLPDARPSAQDDAALQEASRQLLARLKAEALTLTVIRDVLDSALPPAYTPERYERVCAATYEHIADAYAGPGRNVYGEVA